jgi:hypothetical protein
MTISSSLPSIHSHAFESTQSLQHRRSGKVEFSLPPVDAAASPQGLSTPSTSSATVAGSSNPLPPTTIALGNLIQSGSQANHGNAVSARIISKLYAQSR